MILFLLFFQLNACELTKDQYIKKCIKVYTDCMRPYDPPERAKEVVEAHNRCIKKRDYCVNDALKHLKIKENHL